MTKKSVSKLQIKDTVLKNELARAHGMIILLAIALMMVLTISSSLDIVLDPVLAFFAVFLLAIVGVLSLTVIITLIKKRK